MKLHEYQAKQFFAKHGIPIPRGKLATTPEEVEQAARELGGKVVLKSQILVGGRGKAGAIRLANSPEEARKIAGELFGRVFKGHVVKKIYVEEQLDIAREMYIGYVLDRGKKGFTLIVSSVGGMEIEEIAARHPDKISKTTIDPVYGLWDYQVRNALYKASMPPEYFKTVFKIAKKLYEILTTYEAELTEINPLVVTGDGKIIAADARLNVDDNALFRHPELGELRDYTEEDQLERIATERGLNYVKLDGNIGVIANGAGMSMATMDLIYIMGGKPANFLDVGGGASSEVVKKAIETILMDKNVKVIFINIFGGITRCDEVARGIVKALSEMQIIVPIVIRLAGTNEEEGRRILEEFIEKTGTRLHIARTMEEGAQKAVELARMMEQGGEA